MNLYQTKDLINEKVGKDLLLMKLPFISFFLFLYFCGNANSLVSESGNDYCWTLSGCGALFGVACGPWPRLAAVTRPPGAAGANSW